MELKPCPFCGSEVQLYISQDCDDIEQSADYCYVVGCDFTEGGCGASGGHRITEEAAIASWNSRASNKKKGE